MTLIINLFAEILFWKGQGPDINCQNIITRNQSLRIEISFILKIKSHNKSRVMLYLWL